MWPLATPCQTEHKRQISRPYCGKGLCARAPSVLTPYPSLVTRAQVYKGLLDGVQTVAVKRLTDQSPRQQQRFAQEVNVLRSCRAENIVSFLGAVPPPRWRRLRCRPQPLWPGHASAP